MIQSTEYEVPLKHEGQRQKKAERHNWRASEESLQPSPLSLFPLPSSFYEAICSASSERFMWQKKLVDWTFTGCEDMKWWGEMEEERGPPCCIPHNDTADWLLSIGSMVALRDASYPSALSGPGTPHHISTATDDWDQSVCARDVPPI